MTSLAAAARCNCRLNDAGDIGISPQPSHLSKKAWLYLNRRGHRANSANRLVAAAGNSVRHESRRHRRRLCRLAHFAAGRPSLECPD